MAIANIIEQLGLLLREAGAEEGGLAVIRAQFDQLFAEYQNDGVPRDQAVAFATIMLLIAGMKADPKGVLRDAISLIDSPTAGEPRLPLLALAVVLEALK